MNLLIWIRFLFLGSFRNLMRSPRRTLISLLAIAAAASSLIVFQSFVEGVRSTFRENVITSEFGHYQIYDKKADRGQANDAYAHLIEDPEAIRAKIEKEVGPVKLFSRQQKFFGLLSTGDQSAGGRGLGIDADQEKEFLTLTQVHSGKHLADANQESVFIGYTFAEKLGVKPGDYVTLVVTTESGSINAMDLEVAGLFKSGITEMDSNMYMVHYETAEELLQVSGPQRILLGFEGDDELIYDKKLGAVMAASFPALEAVHWQTLATYFENTMGWLDGIFGVFRFIIILIATLSIINVFTITLMERMGEFGTLRAIGTKGTEVISMILVEGFTQAIIGSAIGVAAGIGLITIALGDGISMPPPLLMNVPFQVTFSVPWDGVIITALLCIVVAGGSGLIPAFKMARVNIVEALGRNV